MIAKPQRDTNTHFMGRPLTKSPMYYELSVPKPVTPGKEVEYKEAEESMLWHPRHGGQIVGDAAAYAAK